MGGGEVADGSATPSAAAAAAAAIVHIRCSNGAKFSIHVDLESSVAAFKLLVAENCDVPVEQQRLIYKGRILKDDQNLASYGVESDHTVHLVRGAAPSATPAPASTTNPGPPKTSSSSTTPPSLFGGLPGLGVNSGGSAVGGNMFGLGFPELDQMQQQLSQNPNLMREIMNMPAFQNILNNPDVIRNIIMNNPQMREIIDRNPDLAHILNDPAILRQTMEAARNPEIMREMMRNTDRAMSNIESSPEGFNMLRRMYETVQEPFLNATTMAGEGDANSNPFAALLGNQARSASGPVTGSESTAGSPAPNTNPLPNPWNPNSAGAQQPGARPSARSETRPAGMDGLGSLNMPDLERMMGGGAPNLSLVTQLLQNPAVSQMMQNIMSDPQTMNQMLSGDPNIRNLLESNTQLREMLTNPEFIRQMMSPEILQQMMGLQQSLLSQLGRQQASQDQNQTAGAGGISSLESLMSMLGGLGAADLSVPTANSNVPPEERFATQLTQLQEMGFIDTQENIQALLATNGNVHAAVDRLLGNFAP